MLNCAYYTVSAVHCMRYRRPTSKCAVKRLRFCIFKEIANSMRFGPAWTRRHIRNTYFAFLIIGGEIRIRIYCILAFKCGPTVRHYYTNFV